MGRNGFVVRAVLVTVLMALEVTVVVVTTTTFGDRNIHGTRFECCQHYVKFDLYNSIIQRNFNTRRLLRRLGDEFIEDSSKMTNVSIFGALPRSPSTNAHVSRWVFSMSWPVSRSLPPPAADTDAGWALESRGRRA